MSSFGPHFAPRIARHRLWWLLWLALLLPCAQAAATWHALSHAAIAASADGEGKGVVHGAHCDLCVATAPLTGGALTGAAHVLPPPALRHALPDRSPARSRAAVLATPYLSRAPPPASL